MLTFEIQIINKLGIHARASSKLVELANQFTSKIVIDKEGRTANAKSIMSVMMLSANFGSTINITIDGIDETLAMTKISELINNKFYEEINILLKNNNNI